MDVCARCACVHIFLFYIHIIIIIIIISNIIIIIIIVIISIIINIVVVVITLLFLAFYSLLLRNKISWVLSTGPRQNLHTWKVNHLLFQPLSFLISNTPDTYGSPCMDLFRIDRVGIIFVYLVKYSCFGLKRVFCLHNRHSIDRHCYWHIIL